MNKCHQKEQEQFNQCYESMHVNGTLLHVGYLLKRAARLTPHGIALVNDQREISYRQLYGRAMMFSKTLTDKGVKPRDRVILLFENSIEFYVAYFGILQAGAVVVPLNVFLQDREIVHVVADANPSCLVVSSKFAARVSSLDLGVELPLLTENDLVSYDLVFQTISRLTIVTLEPDELAVLLYTSGTTGLPKGVMLSSRNIMTNIAQGISRFELRGKERIFGVLPLFHSFAQSTCIWLPFFLGYTVIVVPKIDRHAIMHGLAHKPTIFFGVPALYGLLCLLRTASLSSVRLFISGGDALPDKIRSAFSLLYRRKICSGYGLTETSPLISVELSDRMVAANDVGRPLPGIACAFKDDQGNQVPQGQVGELWVSGDNIMMGYYNAPEMTEQVLIDGWFRTGDLAYLNEDGALVIAGRTKDLIINKGFNIYPQEIENVIMMHADVIRAGVIGQDDEIGGQVPIAFIQVKKMSPALPRIIKELCMKNLAAYKVPREFIFTTDELPITATGKVNKKILGEKHIKKSEA